MVAEVVEVNGARRVMLIVPIRYADRVIKSVTIAPVKLDHVLRWSAGDFKTSLALLAELVGLDEPTLRELRYPDVERVMAAFTASLPPAIGNDLAAGTIPTKGDMTPPQLNGGQHPSEHDMPMSDDSGFGGLMDERR